ncbi:MAG: EamA family transporter [Desulfobacterales bacterium]|nr:EamA family transporter [Desulfobacterales bacterium]
MSQMAIFLVLLSASIHVGWNFLTKTSPSPKTFTLLTGIFAIGFFLVAVPFISFNEIPPVVWLYIVLSGGIHTVYFIALSSAYETGDISFVYPIARSSPAFVAIAAFFMLGETVSKQGAIGIGIVIGCVFLIQLRGEGRTGLKKFLSSVKQKDCMWAFITLAAVVAYTLVDKAGMVAFSQAKAVASGTRGLIYYLLQMTLCYLFYLIFNRQRIRPAFDCILRREWPKAAAAALGTMASYTLILHVMQTETVSYIVALRQSSVLMAVLAGGIGLREPSGRWRFFWASVMLAGFYLVATAQ